MWKFAAGEIRAKLKENSKEHLWTLSQRQSQHKNAGSGPQEVSCALLCGRIRFEIWWLKQFGKKGIFVWRYHFAAENIDSEFLLVIDCEGEDEKTKSYRIEWNKLDQ